MTHLLTRRPGPCPPVVDGETVCAVIGSLPDRAEVSRAADLLGVLADPTKLILLTCLAHAGELCVRDLAAASGNVESTVSHALRLLRAHSVVDVRRDGRLALYRLTDDTTARLLDLLLHDTSGRVGQASDRRTASR